MVHQLLVAACAMAGELTQARAYLSEADGVHKPALLSFFEGEWDLAGKILTSEFQQGATAGDRLNVLITALTLAPLHRFAGERVQAVQLLQRSLEISTDSGLILFELATRSSLATMPADAGDAAEALPHLERCRKIVGAGENWYGLAGDVERAEAVVAAAQGEYSAAEVHFEKAIATFQRYSLPWEEADTLQYWGRALVAANEPARAVEKFDAAIEIYRSRGASTRFIDYVMADKMRVQSSTSTHPAAKSRSHIARAEADLSSEEDVFRKEGEFWTISYESRTFRLKDAKGLHYIAYLLSHPGEKFRVHDLVAVVEGPPERPKASARSLATLEVSGDLGNLGPILDDKAKASYRRHRQELREELDEVEAMNDEGRAERTRAEIEMLEQALSRAVGLGGRDRKTSAHAERARVVVTQNIRAVLGKIAGEHPPLGRHLNSAIKTGYLCAYLTEPERTVAWKL